MNPLLLLALGGGAAAVLGSSSTASGFRPAAAGAVNPLAMATALPAGVGKPIRAFGNPMAAAVAMPEGLALKTFAYVAGQPYRLVDAVAMANTAIGWAEFYAQSPDTLYPAEVSAVLVEGPRATLAAILAASLSDREKTRAVICVILLPLVCNEIGYEDSHSPFFKWGLANGPPGAMYFAANYKSRPNEHEDQLARGRLRAFRKWLGRFYALGTGVQQNQISYLTLWICMYFLGPETGCVLRSIDLTREYTSIPWGLPSGPPVSIYRDSEWNLTPTVRQQQRAIVDIFQRMVGWKRDFVLTIPKCESWDPNPCMMQDGWARDIAGVLYDEELLGMTPEAITGATLKIVQHIQRIQLETMLPEVYTAPSNPFFFVMAAIAAAIASVASLGAATAVIAPAVAAGIGVAMSVATTAAGIGQAIQNRASVGAIMQQVLGTSLAKSLISDAALLLPADLTKAGSTMLDAAATIKATMPKGFGFGF